MLRESAVLPQGYFAGGISNTSARLCTSFRGFCNGISHLEDNRKAYLYAETTCKAIWHLWQQCSQPSKSTSSSPSFSEQVKRQRSHNTGIPNQIHIVLQYPANHPAYPIQHNLHHTAFWTNQIQHLHLIRLQHHSFMHTEMKTNFMHSIDLGNGQNPTRGL